VASAVAPDSRGSVRLASADPLGAPLVDPGLLREPGDVERLEAGLSMIRQAAAGGAFARLGVTEAHPGPGVRGGELRAWVRRTVSSYYHAAGTCRIGSGTDQGAVVDPELRVHENRHIDCIPAAARHGTPWEQLVFWFGGNVNVFNVVLGGVCVSIGLTFWWALAAITAGTLIGALLIALHATQGPAATRSLWSTPAASPR
jgi:hypothetical protein